MQIENPQNLKDALLYVMDNYEKLFIVPKYRGLPKDKQLKERSKHGKFINSERKKIKNIFNKFKNKYCLNVLGQAVNATNSIDFLSKEPIKMKTPKGFYVSYKFEKDNIKLWLGYGENEPPSYDLLEKFRNINIDIDKIRKGFEKNLNVQYREYSLNELRELDNKTLEEHLNKFLEANNKFISDNREEIKKDFNKKENAKDKDKSDTKDAKIDGKEIESDINNKDNNNIKKNIAEREIPLNLILYGPPGTGKTYSTKKRAVEICDEKEFTDNAEIKKRYNDLVNEGQIEFITFHQSYGYEDFIEGIKPVLNNNSDNGSISFTIEDGVFKKFCNNDNDNDNDNEHRYLLSLFEGAGNLYLTKKHGYRMFFNDLKKNYDKYFDENKELKPSLPNSIKISEIKIKYKNKEFKNTQVILRKFNNNNENTKTVQIRILNRELYNKLRDDRITNIYLIMENENSGILLAPQNRVFIIDEINRGNISKIFGELITLIEEDKRDEMKVKLPYSHQDFTVASNVYIIGTMNTSDRSIALLDTALRRRFKFEELMPNYDETLLSTNNIQGLSFSPNEFLKKLNTAISFLYDPDHQIGHSYFMENDEAINFSKDSNKFIDIWYDNIIPLIREYFYNDWEKLEYLLGDFIKIKKANFDDGKISEIDEKTKDEVELKYGSVVNRDYDSDFEKFKSLKWLEAENK